MPAAGHPAAKKLAPAAAPKPEAPLAPPRRGAAGSDGLTFGGPTVPAARAGSRVQTCINLLFLGWALWWMKENCPNPFRPPGYAAHADERARALAGRGYTCDFFAPPGSARTPRTDAGGKPPAVGPHEA